MSAKYSSWGFDVAWQHVPDIVTYRLTHGPDTRFLKVAVRGFLPRLAAEAERMRWAIDHLPVPEVLEHGYDGEVQWLVTRQLPGRDATDPLCSADPVGLVRILAQGLRVFHGAPVEDCPYDFRLGPALAQARRHLDLGLIRPGDDFHREHRHLTAEAAVEHLETGRPESEDLVVCHGDYCLPNVLIEAGSPVGFVDLGELGVADRWWDLAVATWSVTWNLGPGYEELFLSEYGVEPDWERIRYYRLMYDVVS